MNIPNKCARGYVRENATGRSACSTIDTNAHWLGVPADPVSFRHAEQHCVDVEELWPTDDAVARRHEEWVARSHARDVECKCMALYVNLICSVFEYTILIPDFGTYHTLETSTVLRRMRVSVLCGSISMMAIMGETKLTQCR